ncbi:hypothetical protein ACF05L_21510 [Streptomyces bobili]|uniref:hypothetical protein n=1 Tax=Streptomyces bobili TaxID=67280 RepID=UPI0036F781A7
MIILVGNAHTLGLAVRMTRTRATSSWPVTPVSRRPWTSSPSSSRRPGYAVSVGATLEDARQVMATAAQGRIRGCAEAEYPLDQVNEALDRLADGSVGGRLVIVP